VHTIYKPKGCVKAKSYSWIELHYTGLLPDGSEFDKAREDETFILQLGKDEVVKGLEQGLKGICEGEKRTVIVPPALGYGDVAKRGANNKKIPGGSTLHFDIECLKVSDEKIEQKEPNIFKRVDTNGDKHIDADEMQAWFKLHDIKASVSKALGEEDTDGDGKISWAEFGGPKGKKDEL
jgi:FKBP-type peptidyl-prolyl cis-trans isomerase 2